MEQEELKIEIEQAESTNADSSLVAPKKGAVSAVKPLAKNGSTTNSIERKLKKSNALPFGRIAFSFMLVLLICFCARPLQLAHLGFLSWESDITNSSSFVDSQIEYADALESQASGSTEFVNKVISMCQKKFGNDDPRTAYASLCLASKLFEKGDVAQAKITWQESLKQLSKSPQKAPKGSTEALRRLGELYEQAGDNDSTVVLYRAAADFWQYFPAQGTQTNLWADLANAYGKAGNFAEAAKYMEMAFAGARDLGIAECNVYRAEKLAEYNIALSHYDLALKYAQLAVAMAKQGLSPQNYFYGAAHRELVLAKAASNAALLDKKGQ